MIIITSHQVVLWRIVSTQNGREAISGRMVGKTPTFDEVQWGTWEGVFLPEGTGMQRPAYLGSMEEASVAGVECLEECVSPRSEGALWILF